MIRNSGARPQSLSELLEGIGVALVSGPVRRVAHQPPFRSPVGIGADVKQRGAAGRSNSSIGLSMIRA